ncbi:MAG: hypothetical protein OEY18_07990 [Candidatus Aminicenantes bacterium]|nr:hypothetical protein [Candidatus Aminicenantes bacterium]MDH5384631.1 hypothetical protein [Candidatus Aminicenantes bacterium]
MGIFRLFELGFQTVNKRIKVAFFLWVVNLLFSVVVIAPLYFLLQKEFSRSLLGDQMAKGNDFLIWLGDFIYKSRDIYPALFGWILVPMVLYLIFNIFLDGGVIGRIAVPAEQTNLSSFLSDCGKYFFRFFRVFVISAIGYIIFFGVAFRLISAAFRLWTENASTEWPLIFASNLNFLIAVLLFSLVRMFFDYVKIRLVVEDSNKAVRATLINFSYIGKRFLRAWSLYLLIGFLVVILFIICILVHRILPEAGVFFLLVLLWQQLYIFSRMWTKMLFFSTEYHFVINHPRP